MLYIILIFTIILIIIVLPFLLKREPKDNKSRRKKDVKISDAQKIEKEKTKRISFLEKIYTGEIDYKFEHIEMFWETRDVDFEKIMERILEKYDMTRALKFLELRVKLVDRATEKELNKLLKKENIDDHIDSIETNLKNKKSLSPGIKAEEIIVESNSRELVSVFKGIVHPVLYNFINGNPATKEYCASVMPFIDFPFKNRLLLGSFMNTTENHVVRYNSMSALLKLKSDKENIFRILHAYCKDEDVDKDSKAIAVRVMGQIPSKDVKKHLLHILDEAEIELKIAAALALGNFCEEDVAEKLIEASE
ncbi:HEAT repeat domain-containing protein, partial [bacterium]|nr:HEAT repeat domain-containing protein [bacterium]